MKLIKSQEEFAAVLKEERAVLFIAFQWSKRSREVEISVKQWEREVSAGPSPFQFYLLDPDQCPFAWKWIGENAADLAAASEFSGVLVWISKGFVAGNVQNTAFPGLQEVRRLTARWFGGSGKDQQTDCIDPELIKILCCPETHQDIKPAEPALVEKMNLQIHQGTVRNRSGNVVGETIEGGLVRADGKYLYPIRHSIPIMLVDEAIAL